MQIGGQTVKDAPKAVTIHITRGDVKKGATKDPAACAAAQACKRELHVTDARIHIGRCYLKINNEWQRFQTSPALRQEIITFDRGGVFAPGTYTLKKVSHSNLGIKKTKPKGAKDNRVKIARRSYHIVSGVREKGANR